MSKFIVSKWVRELVRFLPAKSQFILWGNIHDVYPIELQGNITTLRMDAFINATLRAQGYSLIVKYEPLIGFSLMDKGDAEILKRLTKLESKDGTPIKATLPKRTSSDDGYVQAGHQKFSAFNEESKEYRNALYAYGGTINRFGHFTR